MTPSRLVARATIACVALGSSLLSVACSSDSTALTASITTAVTAALVQKDTGDGQFATVGTTVRVTPRIRVLNARGQGINGVSVAFAASDPSAVLQSAQTTTDANGYASVGAWTLGVHAGVQQLSATVTGFPGVTFTASTFAGAPAQMVVVQGEGQSATAGLPLPIQPAVRLLDTYGNPVTSQLVKFVVGAGGGSVVGDTARTNALGLASPGLWTLGSANGPQILIASTNGTVSPVRITVTASGLAQARASRMVVLSGNNQVGTAGLPAPANPLVQVTDSAGNPINHQLVVFSVLSGGGTVTLATALTDGSGIATPGTWTLGRIPSANTMQVSSAGLTAVTLTATSLVGAPATATLVNGSGQTGKVNTVLPTAPSIRVTDAFGNPVSGIVCIFALTSGGGTLTSGFTMSDANGIASAGVWTVGPVTGTAGVQAVAGSLSPVLFSATIVP